MGFMDLLTGDLTEEQRRALMAAGFSMLQPARNTGEAIGRAGMFGMQAYDEARNLKDARAEKALRDKLLQMQVDMQERAMADDARKRAILSGGNAPAPSPYEDSPAAMTPPMPPRGPSVVDNPAYQQNPLSAYLSQPASAANQPMPRPPSQADILRARVGQLNMAGFVKDAKDLGETLKYIEPEVFDSIHVGKNGAPYLLSKNGQIVALDKSLAPRDELVADSLGGTTRYRTKFSTDSLGQIAHTMTPGEAWQRQKDLLGTVHEGVDPNTGLPALYRVPLQGPAMQVQGVSGKRNPLQSGDAEKLQTFDELVAQTQTAVTALKKNPNAVGPENKLIPDWMLNTFAPIGNIDARAKLADLGSKIVLARSGAAVTTQEFARLEPFLPSKNDTQKVAIAKLKNLEMTFSDIQKSRRSFYASQGYHVPPSGFGQIGVPLGKAGADLSGMSLNDLEAAIVRELNRKP